MKTAFLILAIGFPAFAAEKPLNGAVIVVDPGHGGQSYSKSYTGGTRGVNSKLTESELNLRVSLALAKTLENDGATVFLTRVADHRLSREGSSNKEELHARIDYFEHHNCHFFVSVHHNAGPEAATGHTAIYKHNAKDDTLYEALAREVNDALSAAVPGPKRKLIKDSYHLTRETEIPGTISEAGFLTNAAYDKLANEKDYPQKEADAIAAGVRLYWKTHQDALSRLRTQLMEDRKKSARDPNTYTATALNPDYQKLAKILMNTVAPDGQYKSEKIGDYCQAYLKAFPDASGLKATYDGRKIQLSGTVKDRKAHDRFIDILVAMRLYDIENKTVLLKAKE